MTELIGELFYAAVEWAGTQGALSLKDCPGLWRGKTKAVNGLGPFDVWLNPHKEEIDGIEGYHVGIGSEDHFPPLIACVNPVGGFILPSPIPGEDEAGLIAHFKAQSALTPDTLSQQGRE